MYSVRLPDGRVISDIPDDVPVEEVQRRAAALMRQSAAQAAPKKSFDDYLAAMRGASPAEEYTAPKKTGIMAGFVQGAKAFGGNLATAVEAPFDPVGAATRGAARSEELDKQYESQVDLRKVGQRFDSEGIAGAIKEVGRQVPYMLAENAPNIAGSIAAGKAGAMMGSAFGPAGTAIGALGGAFVGSMVPQFGSNIERQAQEQQQKGQAVNPNVGAAAGAAVGQAALDTASLKLMGGKVLSRFLGVPAEKVTAAATRELEEAAAQSLRKAVGMGALRGTSEAPTEALQQMLERWQAGLPLTSPDALLEYGQAAYAGMGVGTTLGGAMGPIERGQARGELAAREAAAREKLLADEAKATAEKQALEDARKQTPEYQNSLEGLQERYAALGKELRATDWQLKKLNPKNNKSNVDPEFATEEFGALKEKREELQKKKAELEGQIAQARISPEEFLVNGIPTLNATPSYTGKAGKAAAQVENAGYVDPITGLSEKEISDYNKTPATDAARQAAAAKLISEREQEKAKFEKVGKTQVPLLSKLNEYETALLMQENPQLYNLAAEREQTVHAPARKAAEMEQMGSEAARGLLTQYGAVNQPTTTQPARVTYLGNPAVTPGAPFSDLESRAEFTPESRRIARQGVIPPQPVAVSNDEVPVNLDDNLRLPGMDAARDGWEQAVAAQGNEPPPVVAPQRNISQPGPGTLTRQGVIQPPAPEVVQNAQTAEQEMEQYGLYDPPELVAARKAEAEGVDLGPHNTRPQNREVPSGVGEPLGLRTNTIRAKREKAAGAIREVLGLLRQQNFTRTDRAGTGIPTLENTKRGFAEDDAERLTTLVETAMENVNEYTKLAGDELAQARAERGLAPLSKQEAAQRMQRVRDQLTELVQRHLAKRQAPEKYLALSWMWNQVGELRDMGYSATALTDGPQPTVRYYGEPGQDVLSPQQLENSYGLELTYPEYLKHLKSVRSSKLVGKKTRLGWIVEYEYLPDNRTAEDTRLKKGPAAAAVGVQEYFDRIDRILNPEVFIETATREELERMLAAETEAAPPPAPVTQTAPTPGVAEKSYAERLADFIRSIGGVDGKNLDATVSAYVDAREQENADLHKLYLKARKSSTFRNPNRKLEMTRALARIDLNKQRIADVQAKAEELRAGATTEREQAAQPRPSAPEVRGALHERLAGFMAWNGIGTVADIDARVDEKIAWLEAEKEKTREVAATWEAAAPTSPSAIEERARVLARTESRIAALNAVQDKLQTDAAELKAELSSYTGDKKALFSAVQEQREKLLNMSKPVVNVWTGLMGESQRPAPTDEEKWQQELNRTANKLAAFKAALTNPDVEAYLKEAANAVDAFNAVVAQAQAGLDSTLATWTATSNRLRFAKDNPEYFNEFQLAQTRAEQAGAIKAYPEAARELEDAKAALDSARAELEALQTIPMRELAERAGAVITRKTKADYAREREAAITVAKAKIAAALANHAFAAKRNELRRLARAFAATGYNELSVELLRELGPKVEGVVDASIEKGDTLNTRITKVAKKYPQVGDALRELSNLASIEQKFLNAIVDAKNRRSDSKEAQATVNNWRSKITGPESGSTRLRLRLDADIAAAKKALAEFRKGQYGLRKHLVDNIENLLLKPVASFEASLKAADTAIALNKTLESSFKAEALAEKWGVIDTQYTPDAVNTDESFSDLAKGMELFDARLKLLLEEGKAKNWKTEAEAKVLRLRAALQAKLEQLKLDPSRQRNVEEQQRLERGEAMPRMQREIVANKPYYERETNQSEGFGQPYTGPLPPLRGKKSAIVRTEKQRAAAVEARQREIESINERIAARVKERAEAKWDKKRERLDNEIAALETKRAKIERDIAKAQSTTHAETRYFNKPAQAPTPWQAQEQQTKSTQPFNAKQATDVLYMPEKATDAPAATRTPVTPAQVEALERAGLEVTPQAKQEADLTAGIQRGAARESNPAIAPHSRRGEDARARARELTPGFEATAARAAEREAANKAAQARADREAVEALAELRKLSGRAGESQADLLAGDEFDGDALAAKPAVGTPESTKALRDLLKNAVAGLFERFTHRQSHKYNGDLEALRKNLDLNPVKADSLHYTLSKLAEDTNASPATRYTAYAITKLLPSDTPFFFRPQATVDAVVGATDNTATGFTAFNKEGKFAYVVLSSDLLNDSKLDVLLETLLHEGLHAALMSRLGWLGKLPASSVQQLRQVHSEFAKFVNENRTKLEADPENASALAIFDTAVADDIDEFLVYSLTNSTLQGFMKKYSQPQRQSWWQAFKDWAWRIWSGETKSAPPWFEAVMAAGNAALEEAAASAPDYKTAIAQEAEKELKARKQADQTPKVIHDIHKKYFEGPSQSALGRGKQWLLGLEGMTNLVDRFAPIVAVSQRMTDALKGMQMEYFNRMVDMLSNYSLQVMTHGAPRLEQRKRADGRMEYFYTTDKGANLTQIADVLAGEDMTAWGDWMRVKRAQKVGFEKMGIQIEQTALNTLLSYGDNNPKYREAQRLYNEYSGKLLDFTVQTGALSEREAERMRDLDYFGYYRDRDTGMLMYQAESPIVIGNIKDHPHLASLVGSTKPMLDPVEAMVVNTRTLMRMALTNMAAKNTAHTLSELGLGKFAYTSGKKGQRLREDPRVGLVAEDRASPVGRTVLHFKEHGQERQFVVDTAPNAELANKYGDIPAELLVKGLEGIATTIPALVNVMGIPARFLRFMITHNPIYPLRQLMRDPVSAYVTTGTGLGVVKNSLKEVGNILLMKDGSHSTIASRGIVGGQMISGLADEDVAESIRAVSSGQGIGAAALAKLGQFGMAADAATRVALYDDFKKKGFSELEAVMGTMQSINFTTRGLSSSMHALNMMIPFFNAQVQSLNTLYKAMSGNMPFNERLRVRQKFFERGMTIAALSMLYFALASDEEWYKNAPNSVRLGNFLIPTPFTDEPVKIPIPFEVGLIFKAVPEAMMIAASDDPQAASVLKALRSQALNALPGGSSMMMPQAVKPLIETATNYNTFTGRSIVPQHLANAPAAAQYDRNTTEIVRGMADMLGVSPMLAEHLFKGYTGPLGFAVLQMLNAPFAMNRPDARLTDTPLIGTMFQPLDAGGIISAAYDAIEKIEGAKAVQKNAMLEGRPQDVDADTQKMLGAAPLAASVKAQISQLSQRENQIRFTPSIPAEQKRAMLDQIRQQKIAIARSASPALSRAVE